MAKTKRPNLQRRNPEERRKKEANPRMNATQLRSFAADFEKWAKGIAKRIKSAADELETECGEDFVVTPGLIPWRDYVEDIERRVEREIEARCGAATKITRLRKELAAVKAEMKNRKSQ